MCSPHFTDEEAGLHQQAFSLAQNQILTGSLVPDILPSGIHSLTSQVHFSFQESPIKMHVVAEFCQSKGILSLSREKRNGKDVGAPETALRRIAQARGSMSISAAWLLLCTLRQEERRLADGREARRAARGSHHHSRQS